MKQRFQELMEKFRENKKGATDLKSGVGIAIAFFGGILTLTVMGFVLIILAGNLSDSSGLTDGSSAYNDTQNMLTNVSSASADFFSNATTWFGLLSVVIIIAVVVIVLNLVRKTRGAGE